MRVGRAVAVLIAAAFFGSVRGDVRPLSAAEKAAVEVAAAYLSGGAERIADRLSATSPLRQLPESGRAAELEARIGPPDGTRWELQTVVQALADRMAVFTVRYPSGAEDHITFEMVAEGGAFRLHDVRGLAEPSGRKALFPAAATVPAQGFVEADGTSRRPAVAALAAALVAFGAVFLARRRTVSRILALAAAAAALAAIGLGIVDVVPRGAQTPAANASLLPAAPSRAILGPLLALRRAVAQGGDVESAFKACDRGGGRGAVADLWKAQNDVLQMRVAEAKATLGAFPTPDRPLAEVLRLNVAVLENDDIGAAVAFERAVNLGPGRDALWLDRADFLYSQGFQERAKASFERLAEIGSRRADVYYALASIAAGLGKADQAEAYLRTAWQMEPAERANLVETPMLWSVLRRPGLTELVSLSAPAEPRIAPGPSGREPLILPPDADRRTSGELLMIDVAGREIRVPGGAAVAPPNTEVIDAVSAARASEERSLADFDALVALRPGVAAYAQPSLRQRIGQTVFALARHQRWPQVIALTDGVAVTEHVPPSVLLLRGVGLQRVRRTDEARRLMAQIAASPVLVRRRDSSALIQIAEFFASQDMFDEAVRMYDRAQAIRPNAFVDDRVRQIQMNKRLATSYSTHATPHFEIRYPNDVSSAEAIVLGERLEKELSRLQAWIPVAELNRVVVNVVWWQEFRSTYTGNDYVLGFYNGKITVPFAGLPSEHPELVNILAHELAHAMVAQATDDQAPRWFQEGLAQRIEQRDYHANAFNMYDDAKLIPMALLDPVLAGSADPEMVGAGYITAQTNIRFFEDRFGRTSLHRLMAAFREGATMEDAVRRATGKSLAEVELELRAWGRGTRRVFDGRS